MVVLKLLTALINGKFFYYWCPYLPYLSIILFARYVLARAAIGRDDFQLQGLKFALNEEEKHRLFGISLRGFVFELDLASLTMKNVRDSYGGNVWCIAMSPRDPYFSVGS